MGKDVNPIVEAPIENQETENMEPNGTENNEAEYFKEDTENEESGELQAKRIFGSDE